MRYSHVGCNVVHEDLAYNLGVDIHAVHEQLKHSVSDCGGKLPAEHGHGTEYTAPIESHKRWMKMDPLNVMNPGIGGLSSKFKYGRSQDICSEQRLVIVGNAASLVMME